MPLRISALVPTLNEESSIARTLSDLRVARLDEVIVVDGGSGDATLARAGPLSDHVLREEGGLFAQLNRAAREATGDVLLFHYADVRFPAGGREAMERLLGDSTVLAGAFRLAFDTDRWPYRIIAAGANARNRLGVGPFGDQSIFVRAEVFRLGGGFDTRAFLPDLRFVSRVRRLGCFAILPERVRASTRRWEKQGVLRTLFSHWRLTLLYVVSGGRGLGGGTARARELTRVR